MVAAMSKNDPISGKFVSSDAPPPSRVRLAHHHIKRFIKDPIGQFIIVFVVGVIIASLAAAGVIATGLAWFLLFLAWIAAVGGSYLLDHLWDIRSKHRIAVGIVLAIPLAGIGGYERIMQPEASDNGGAVVVVSAPGARRTQDGKYYFPVQMENLGKKELTGFNFTFGYQEYGAEASPQTLDSFMKDLEHEVSDITKLDPASIRGHGAPFTMNNPYSWMIPNSLLSEDEYQKVINGEHAYYYGVSIVYMDDTAEKKNILYFSESCFRYEPKLQASVNCVGRHTFVKNRSFPP
jgi:hypothetical protein